MHSLSLANRHDQLAALSPWLDEFAQRWRLPDRDAFRLELVVTEAVTNVMDYCQRPDATGHIELSCDFRDGQIRLQVADDGPPFDPTARAPAILPRSLDEATPGGLGIHLIRQYTSVMTYRREGDRNILTLALPVEHLETVA